jgi:hypothetical protein
MSLKGGTLIFGTYKTMRVNRPIPWIGMPIYYCDHWRIVDCESSGGSYAGFGSTVLSTYRKSEPDSRSRSFILPGEPDVPHMDEHFAGRVAGAYVWREHVRYVDGLWRVVPTPGDSDRHTALPLPRGAEMGVVLPNNRVSSNSETLKKSNTDGRLNCASCNYLLKQSWFGNINMNYCPVCEG